MNWQAVINFGIKWGPVLVDFARQEAGDFGAFIADVEAAAKTQNFFPVVIKWAPIWAKVVQTNAPNFQSFIKDVEALFNNSGSSGPLTAIPPYSGPTPIGGVGLTTPPGGFRS